MSERALSRFFTIDTKNQIADALTKALAQNDFTCHCKFMYVRQVTSPRYQREGVLRISTMHTITHEDTLATYLAYLPTIRIPLGYSSTSRSLYCGTAIFYLGFSRKNLGDSKILLEANLLSLRILFIKFVLTRSHF